MGSIQSTFGGTTTNTTKCQSNDPSKAPYNPEDYIAKPPSMERQKSFDEKLFDKFTKQPLVPIGCIATVYFLGSGIKSFQNRETRRAQKMMRARVGAQFATLLAFIGYVGVGSFNVEIAPRYQQYKKHQEKLEAEAAASGGDAAQE
mmetsp:Transcript_19070/g.52958  ORF Transcript_19070/g.52958 Transcript_19070/m.52958 type:complete len:146 (-) Transcript_19070:581-1018(-)